MIHWRSDHTCIALGGYIYVIGCNANDKFKASCEKYDVANDKWERIARLSSPWAGVGLC